MADPARFWWQEDLPQVTLREVDDGRQVCYAPHSHDTFSVGLITHGACRYRNLRQEQPGHAGLVVMMNPGDVHACNPIQGGGWGYLMFYVDTAWLAGLQHPEDDAPGAARFQPIAAIASAAPWQAQALLRLATQLRQPDGLALARAERLVATFDALLQAWQPQGAPRQELLSPGVQRAAEYLGDHWQDNVTLAQLCAVSGLSASHLIRHFERRYGLTPHAYLLNHRIQHSLPLLRRDMPLADVAQATGFADQPHFQRIFKRLLATTPGHYRRDVQGRGRRPAHVRPTPAPAPPN